MKLLCEFELTRSCDKENYEERETHVLYRMRPVAALFKLNTSAAITRRKMLDERGD